MNVLEVFEDSDVHQPARGENPHQKPAEQSSVLDTCSYFIKDRALFGGYPTTEKVKALEDLGVKFFVDLTSEDERLEPYEYSQTSTYISYPIKDRSIPSNIQSFSKLIIRLSQLIQTLKNNDKMYIHCKGGHGRSGIIVACILCYLFDLPPDEALARTNVYHSDRKIMREKWRLLGSPQTRVQKRFVQLMFKPFYFNRAVKYGPALGLSNFSLHSVSIPNFGTFPTAEACFQAFKDPNNNEYVERLVRARTPSIAKSIGSKSNIRSDWDQIKVQIMYNIIFHKFDQHEDIRQHLLRTGLRPLIEHTKYDLYWGDGGDGSGKNVFGKLLTQLRNKLLVKT